MQQSIAFYLKYRPQILDDLIGQDEVKQTLLASFKNDKLSHAYLFVGPRGTGKTSTARILAKMVNCESQDNVILGSEERATPESNNKNSGRSASRRIARITNGIPCNKCSTCLSITDGSNLDLIEIDAASNRGIEDIRSLRDKIKLSPTNAKKKVYIIDEVHMLTTEAFNALLKTLEEPPAHALFILATTESYKLPQTILSRVQRLDFKLARPHELIKALSKIIKEEKIDIEEEALKILVRRADGSFRDGVKLLDQISVGATKITAKSVEENLKTLQFDDLLNLIKSLSKQSTNESLLNVSKQMENGVDIKELMLSLMDLLRKLIFIKNGLGEGLVKPHFTEDDYEELVVIADSFSSQDIVRNLGFLQDALEKIKFASIVSLPLELAIVEICGEQPPEDRKGANKTIDDRKLKIDVEDRSSKLEDSKEDLIFNTQPQDPVSSIQHPTSNDDIQKLRERWTFVLETIRPFNFSLEALLRSINVTECTETTVIMEVPYSFHQRILEAPKNKDILESILSDILGRNIRISIALGNRPERHEDIANVEVAGDDEIIRAAAEIFNSDTVN